jgi:hypothetical protein
MENKKNLPVTNIGTVSLMMIFIILCLVIFATLSLTDAKRDFSFSQKLADHTSEYYAASNQSEYMVAKIDEILKNTDDTTNYLNQVAAKITSDIDIPVTFESDNQSMLLSWQIDMNDSQALYTRLNIDASTHTFKILSWCEIETAEWHTDNTLKLIE